MPSECQWVFDWIFTTVIPYLLGTESLRRVQLFLSDGDPKIYKCFDSVQPSLFPNAIHGLCIYHLVVQGLDKLKRSLHGLTRLVINNQINTVKHWLYTWMGIGGVETEEEFNISYEDFSKWLFQQKTSNDKDISHNAVVINDWFIKKILHHKQRWLFVYRKHLMSLGQKTTSALEGINHSIKVKSSKKVTPNMTLLQSFKTMEIQQDIRMQRWKKDTMSKFEALPTWTDRTTAKYLSPVCDSQILQSCIQKEKYLCKVIKFEENYGEIHVIRSKSQDIFCSDCTSTEICPKCNSLSPITRFRR